MSGKCRYLQLPPQFCQKYVPSNTLDKLNTTKRQNPQESSANGYDILDPTKPQVLSWKPTTEGTVSLKLYRAPGEGEQYADGDDISVGLLDQQYVIPKIENTGNYTWTPYQISYDPLESVGDLQSRRVFTFSIVPDGDPSKADFWPPFAIGETHTNDVLANSTSKPTSTSRTLPDTQASTATLSYTDLPSSIVTDSTPFATSAVLTIILDSTTTTPTGLRPTVIHARPTPASSPPSSTSTTSTSKPPRNVSPGVVAAIALGAVTIVLLSLFIGVLACNRRRKREALHELPVADEYHHYHPRTQYWEKRSTADSTHDKWRREKERERMREKELERVELESGWGPPEMEGRRLHPRRDRGTLYKSPRVSVPPKSRVVSYYL